MQQDVQMSNSILIVNTQQQTQATACRIKLSNKAKTKWNKEEEEEEKFVCIIFVKSDRMHEPGRRRKANEETDCAQLVDLYVGSEIRISAHACA